MGALDYFAKHGMMVLLGLTCAKPRRKMSVHSLVAYEKERVTLSIKESICQQFSREHSYYLQLNFEVRKDGWMPRDGRHGIVDITPHIDPKVPGQCRRKSGVRFYVKHKKEIEGHVVIRKRAVKMINEATAKGLEKEEIQYHLCNAWKCIFNEECLGLDDNGLSGVRDTHKEEEHSDLTGGNVDGAAGSADALQENSEENLQTQLEVAATQLNKPLFNNL